MDNNFEERSAVTILFTDIEGSTAYFEQKGDVEGLAMVQHHNDLAIPIIEDEDGRVIKTIGDSIMSCFDDPVAAVRAAIAIQRALQADREDQSEDLQIHIRIGLHTGMGLFKDNDVFGDVVNAAARVQHQAQPDQILITDVLLDAAKAAGAQCAKLGRADMKGKDEAIDVYAVAWSVSAGNQLIEEVESQYERRLKESKRQQDLIEEELEAAREQWRNERRRLTGEIEELEEALENSRASVRQEASQDLQAEIRFQLEESEKNRQQAERELVAMQKKWELERTNLKAQIATMQGAALEAMERSNNPTRLALAVREQVDARLRDAKQDWQLEWDGERRRLEAEIGRLKKAGNLDDKKEAARRAFLEQRGKLPASSKTAAQWEKEFEDAKIQWESERDKLTLTAERLERESQRAKEEMRNEIFAELRGQYDPRIAEAEREHKRLQEELAAVHAQSAEDRRRMELRIAQLEEAMPRAQEAVRAQVTAELQGDVESRIDELNRVKGRSERRLQESVEELEGEVRRCRKQIAQLEEQLKEARETAFRAQRTGGSPSS